MVVHEQMYSPLPPLLQAGPLPPAPLSYDWHHVLLYYAHPQHLLHHYYHHPVWLLVRGTLRAGGDQGGAVGVWKHVIHEGRAAQPVWGWIKQDEVQDVGVERRTWCGATGVVHSMCIG